MPTTKAKAKAKDKPKLKSAAQKKIDSLKARYKAKAKRQGTK